MSFIFLRAFPALEPSSLRGIPGVIHPPPARVGSVSGFPSAGLCFARSDQPFAKPQPDRERKAGAGATGTGGTRQPPLSKAGCASERRPACGHGSIKSVTAHASRAMLPWAVSTQVKLLLRGSPRAAHPLPAAPRPAAPGSGEGGSAGPGGSAGGSGSRGTRVVPGRGAQRCLPPPVPGVDSAMETLLISPPALSHPAQCI